MKVRRSRDFYVRFRFLMRLGPLLDPADLQERWRRLETDIRDSVFADPSLSTQSMGRASPQHVLPRQSASVQKSLKNYCAVQVYYDPANQGLPITQVLDVLKIKTGTRGKDMRKAGLAQLLDVNGVPRSGKAPGDFRQGAHDNWRTVIHNGSSSAIMILTPAGQQEGHDWLLLGGWTPPTGPTRLRIVS
jgi:hypothetical protein